MQNKELPAPHLDDNPLHEAQWDIDTISTALAQEPEVATDIAHGAGIRYDLADGALIVELFPPHAERTSGIIRLSTADSHQEFFRQPAPAVRDDGLIFQAREQLLTVTATGHLASDLAIKAETRVGNINGRSSSMPVAPSAHHAALRATKPPSATPSRRQRSRNCFAIGHRSSSPLPRRSWRGLPRLSCDAPRTSSGARRRADAR